MADNTQHRDEKPGGQQAADQAHNEASSLNPDQNPNQAGQQGDSTIESIFGDSGEFVDLEETPEFNIGPGSNEGGEMDSPQSPLEALARENDALEAQVGELKDQILRMHAEMENLRRRTQKDVADARSYSIAGFAREMLSVTDNLRRAIEAVPADEVSAGQGSGLGNLLEGVQLTERAMLNALEKNGVKEISPKGEKFDPHFHQAMFEVQNPEVPHNTVFEVVQSGYVIGERVLRPAMVGVAKGGPKLAAVPEGE